MSLKKNDIVNITIEDNGAAGEGVGRLDGFTLFVDESVKGDVLQAKVLKLKKNYGYAKIVDIIKSSEMRKIPSCELFSKCGGCNLQHMSYNGQLSYKTKKVSEALKRVGGFENVVVNEIIGMDEPYNYRNKAQFPVGEKNGELAIGFFSPRSHTIINTDRCLIQNPVNEEIIKIFRQYITDNKIKPYDELPHEGTIRHILTRTGFKTGEIMVCAVVNGSLPFKEKLIEKLKTIKNMTGISVNYNNKKTNVILGERVETIWGKPYITDYIGDMRFLISPLSFYQVNPVQTEILYKKALEFCGLTGNENVLDLYCGIGTISLFLAQRARHVYGVELVEDAIKDAERNAQINNIENVTFICGDAANMLREFYGGRTQIDIVVIDPPRKGCEEELLNGIIAMKPRRIVYVSCDPATLARDLKILCAGGFSMGTIQPVDMFPQTYHVETVVLIQRKDCL